MKRGDTAGDGGRVAATEPSSTAASEAPESAASAASAPPPASDAGASCASCPLRDTSTEASCEVAWGAPASSVDSWAPEEQAEAHRKTHPERHRRAIRIAL